MKHKLKVGKYILVSNINEIAEIIDMDVFHITCKTVIDEDNPKFVGNIFTVLLTRFNNKFYRLATKKETFQINKKLTFQ